MPSKPSRAIRSQACSIGSREKPIDDAESLSVQGRLLATARPADRPAQPQESPARNRRRFTDFMLFCFHPGSVPELQGWYPGERGSGWHQRQPDIRIPRDEVPGQWLDPRDMDFSEDHRSRKKCEEVNGGEWTVSSVWAAAGRVVGKRAVRYSTARTTDGRGPSKLPLASRAISDHAPWGVTESTRRGPFLHFTKESTAWTPT